MQNVTEQLVPKNLSKLRRRTTESENSKKMEKGTPSDF